MKKERNIGVGLNIEKTIIEDQTRPNDGAASAIASAKKRYKVVSSGVIFRFKIPRRVRGGGGKEEHEGENRRGKFLHRKKQQSCRQQVIDGIRT